MDDGIRPPDVAIIGLEVLWVVDTMNEVDRGLGDIVVRDFPTVLAATDQLEPGHPVVFVCGPECAGDVAEDLAALRDGHPERAFVFAVEDPAGSDADRVRTASGHDAVAAGDTDVLVARVEAELVAVQDRVRLGGSAASAGTGTATSSGTGATGRAAGLVAVTAGKGGVGTTTVAVNLALALQAKDGTQVGIVDAHRGTGDVALLLGLAPVERPLDDSVDATTVDRHVRTHPSGLLVVTAPLQGIGALSVAELLAVVVALEPRVDHVVVDVPGALLVGADIATLAAAVVVVTSTTTASIKNTVVLLDELGRHDNQQIVLNAPAADLPDPGRLAIEDATGAPIAGELPFDDHLAATSSTVPISGVADPRSKVAKRLGELADDIVERSAAQR